MASDFDVEWDEPTKGLGARKPAGGLKLGGTKPKVRKPSLLKHLFCTTSRRILATSSANQGIEKLRLIRGG